MKIKSSEQLLPVSVIGIKYWQKA